MMASPTDPQRRPRHDLRNSLIPIDGFREPLVSEIAASRGQLLIVEDDADHREMLSRRLSAHGFSVRPAESAPEALALLEEHAVDLVLLDLMMPRPLGVELLRQIRRSFGLSELPVVMATAIDASEHVVAALEAGANDYVVKPLDLPVLLARIETQLSLKRARARIDRDLRAARELQDSLLPRRLPPEGEARGFELHATFTPAREVGGDLYDYFFLDEHHLCFLIGDVVDKSVSAALYMMAARFVLRTEARGTLLPEEVLRRVNRTLAADNEKCIFVSVLCGVLDTRSGALRIASAGHNRPVHRRADGCAQPLVVPQGLVIGALEDSRYESRVVQLAPGELVLVYTDGVTEACAPDGELFGTPRLVERVAGLGANGARALVEGLLREVDAFTRGRPAADDLSLLALGYRR